MIDDAAIDAAIAHYQEHGWARLGKVADEATLESLRTRANAIMMGEVTYPGLFYQHDATSGRYEDLRYGEGWQGPSLAYRKIEKLELDPLYWEWIRNDVFRRVAAKVYPEVDVTLYRAFLMNKHKTGGSDLPWHQDGGSFWGLDRDPVLQIWTGLDDAPLDGGCVEFAVGSHRDGLATPLGGVVPKVKLDTLGPKYQQVRVPTVAGEVLLIHNHVWHRSGRALAGKPRRALSVCYMDGRTACRRKKRTPRTFVQVFAASGSNC